MDVRRHNREAWDRYVEHGNRWTVPVTPEDVAAARGGRFKLLLTPTRPVPEGWFPPLVGSDVLCLAGGGGQQGPLLAAAGAQVTVLDASPRQLARDREVAAREGLHIRTVEGDMADLAGLGDATFHLVVHPVSNCFVPDVRPVWREAARVLRAGGVLLSGFANPALYLFDDEEVVRTGELRAAYRLPYSDSESLPPERLGRVRDQGLALEFSHSFEDQIGGQLEAGFVLTGLYEDRVSGDHLVSSFMPTFVATRARRTPLGGE